MKLNIFLDTNIIHRIADIDKEKADNLTYEEDREFLRKVLEIVAKDDEITLYVNPSVLREIEKTGDEQKKKRLLKVATKYEFLPFNLTILPFRLPATLISNEQVKKLKEAIDKISGLEKDKKIIADAGFCKTIDVLLTTDRKHLADKEIEIANLKVFTPRQLFEYIHA